MTNMVTYDMTVAQYGNPNAQLTQTQNDQFIRGIGDVGSGLYRDYNQSGSLPVTMSYTWNGPQMADFRSAWEDVSLLSFGAGWFTIELPVIVGFRPAANLTTYTGHFVTPFSATLMGYDHWKVQMQIEVDPSPTLVIA